MNEYDTNLFYYGHQRTNIAFFSLISSLKNSYFLSDNFGINVYVCPYRTTKNYRDDIWNHWFLTVLINDSDQVGLKINNSFNQRIKNGELDFTIKAKANGLPGVVFCREKFIKCVGFLTNGINDTYYEVDMKGNYTKSTYFDGIENILEYLKRWRMYTD